MLSRLRIFGGLFVLALALRAMRYPLVVSDAGVQLPFAGDAYYHLRRIWFSVHRFPETLPFDRYVSFPNGSEIVWPAAFDWIIAALIRPFVDATEQGAVEALAVWAPALLGAATAVLVAWLADRRYGRVAAWSAGLLYSLMPISFMFSQLGMIDHHVAVALLGAIVIGLVWNLLESTDAVAASWKHGVAIRSMALGLALAVSILLWPGFLLHAGLVQLALASWWLSADDTQTSRMRAGALVSTQAVVALCVAPFSLGLAWREYGAWSPLVLSSFQPVYFGCAATAVAIAQVLHERSQLGESRLARWLSAATIGVLGASLALLFAPGLWLSIVGAAGWFTGEEDLLGRINEMKPILMRRDVFGLDFPINQFGAGFLVFPLVWLHFAWRERGSRRAPQTFLLFWSLAFFVLTLMQWRFGNTLAVALAILLGAAISEAAGRLISEWPSPSRAVLAGALAALVIVVWTAHVWIRHYRPTLQASVRALADPELRRRGPLLPKIRIFDEAARFLASETPPTRGYLDPQLDPEYGVLTSWSTGHLMRYRAQRPMVQDNFGPYAGRSSFEAAWDYFAQTDEEAAIGILERLGVRYVVGGPVGAGTLQGLGVEAMGRRLGTAYGAGTRFKDGRWAPGLARHRLIFHAHSMPPDVVRRRVQVPRPFVSLGVWEVVAGAQIEGLAPPGETVSLALVLSASSGASHVYRRVTRSDREGRYRFVVPYPTGGSRFSPAVRTGAAYRIGTRDSVADLRVEETDVRQGSIVRGPDLRGSQDVD